MSKKRRIIILILGLIVFTILIGLVLNEKSKSEKNIRSPINRDSRIESMIVKLPDGVYIKAKNISAVSIHDLTITVRELDIVSGSIIEDTIDAAKFLDAGEVLQLNLNSVQGDTNKRYSIPRYEYKESDGYLFEILNQIPQNTTISKEDSYKLRKLDDDIDKIKIVGIGDAERNGRMYVDVKLENVSEDDIVTGKLFFRGVSNGIIQSNLYSEIGAMKSDENKIVSLEKVPEVDMEILSYEYVVTDEESRYKKSQRYTVFTKANLYSEYKYDIEAEKRSGEKRIMSTGVLIILVISWIKDFISKRKQGDKII